MTRVRTDKIKKHVLSKLKISKLIQSYGLDLISESGGRYKMRCPFHEEKTASMKVYPDTNTYFCYGCGAGYTVIDFVMNYESISYLEVIERFGKNVDITSDKFIIEEINKKLGGSKVSVAKYANAVKYRLGVTLRDYLRSNKDKETVVDSCFKDMDLYFSDIDNLSEDKVDYLMDEIMERIENES